MVVALDGLRFGRAPCPASGYDELVVSPRQARRMVGRLPTLRGGAGAMVSPR
ncbi:hypothetical protein [Oceanicola sp. D3]|uniref:hypothetical protein n=1 Tax=Oceanicola sp. D3 TaxID=2587163 RepID=UPI00143CF6E0|nr:hypothetical protein [Oceanicola sp. D3]